MKIALIGYGKMGLEIEKIAIRKGHIIVTTIDSEAEWEKKGHQLKMAEVAIEFSNPDVVVENIYKCFEANIPVVVGTTGWYEYLEVVKRDCIQLNQSLFYSTNFSIGVNIFFDLNRHLATLMSNYSQYEISIEETHHIHKQDAPSGTAIVIANDIIRYLKRKEKWVNDLPEHPDEIEIKSLRTENVPGTHVVRYESEDDVIEISHSAKSRRGLATGALEAAEWLIGRKGYFEMKDMLSENINSEKEK